ncbi:hypothetical protein BDN72DRAFT_845766, partial [Pluteus cervinus]
MNFNHNAVATFINCVFNNTITKYSFPDAQPAHRLLPASPSPFATPGLGMGPMLESIGKGVIIGLTRILGSIEKTPQHRDVVNALTKTISDLKILSDEIPAREGDSEFLHRFTSHLNKVQDGLSRLHDHPKYQYRAVAKEIAQCNTNLQHHLTILAVSSNQILLQELGKRVTEIKAVVKEVPMGLEIKGDLVFEDATGGKHRLLLEMITSVKQFETHMKAMFMGNERPEKNKALLEYVDANAFELYTDKGGVIKKNADLSQVANRNTTVKMRVVVDRKQQPRLRSNQNREIVASFEYGEEI